MKIQIDPHTLERAVERGTDVTEIEEVLANGVPLTAKRGRLGRGKVYDFRQVRLGRYFEQKRVEVYYVVEDDVIITVTVYVFYGKWEVENASAL